MLGNRSFWTVCLIFLVGSIVSLGSCTSAKPPSLRRCQACIRENAADPSLSQAPDCRLCFEIRTRRLDHSTEKNLIDDYGEEYAYIDSRRRVLALRPEPSGAPTTDSEPAAATPTELPGATLPEKPAGLIGIALSGGGIRSASFSLGALQAMVGTGIYDQLDYMSSVSGGGYLAGWLQAHLGARASFTEDKDGYAVHADDPAELFANDGDHVEHLRAHTGFLNTGGWFPGLIMTWDWLKRWPAHMVMDWILHLRGDDAWYHIMPIYEDRIQNTYFRGTPPPKLAAVPLAQLPLTEINDLQHGDRSPYLIINGILSNHGDSQIHAPMAEDEKWNFEFTRDFVGSDATGYVDTRGFGLNAWRVHRDKEGAPIVMVAEPGSPDSSPFRLSQAVAASGAAFDSLTVADSFVDWSPARELTQVIGGGLLNLYLGLEVPNFARRGDSDGWNKLRDVFYMETFQRIPRLVTPRASWLYVADGGFHENLGVLALLRRGVSCVVALDAGADPRRQYDDLKTLRGRVENDLNLRWLTDLPAPGADANVAYRFVVGDADGQPKAVILYLKASADGTRPHLQEKRGLRRIKRLRAAELHNVRTLFQSLRNAAVADKTLRPADANELFDSEGALLTAVQAYYTAVDATLSSQATSVTQQGASQQLIRTQIGEIEQKLIGLQARRADILRPTPVPPALADESDAAIVAPTPTSTPADVVALNEEEQLYRLQLENYRMLLQSEPVATGSPGTKELATEQRHELDEQIRKVEERMTTLGKGHPSFQARAGASWAGFQEVGESLAKRLDKDRATRSDWPIADEELRQSIKRVNAFAASEQSFPHDTTLKQTYEWERFEAYRMLGWVTARTYLDPFDRPADAGTPEWCRLADTTGPFSMRFPADTPPTPN